MKSNVIYATPDLTVREATMLLIEKKVGTLPIVDKEKTLIGVTTLKDIIHIFLPDFVTLLTDIDFVKDYGNSRLPAEKDVEQAEALTVAEIMSKPVAVEGESSLIRALSMLEKHNIVDLCVVDEGKLIGIASRVDLGTAFLSDWQPRPSGD
jgi:CBS domain-containing protein